MELSPRRSLPKIDIDRKGAPQAVQRWQFINEIEINRQTSGKRHIMYHPNNKISHCTSQAEAA